MTTPEPAPAGADRPRLRVVLAGHTSLGGSFVIGSHHLARELTRLGHDVVHVSTPVTAAHLARLQDPEVRRRFRLAARPDRADGVDNVVPAALLPWSVKRAAPWLWRHDLAVAGGLRRRVGGPVDVLVLDQPKLVGLVDLLRPRRTVYRATDLYATMPGNAGTARAELVAASRADALVATSAPVADHLRGLLPGRPVEVLPNGVDLELFSRPAPLPAEYSAEPDRPRLVYVGSLDARFDLAALETLAAARPDVELVVIGPTTAATRVRPAPANLRYLGPRPHAEVPGYLQHATAGLLLLSDHPSNAGRSPMKLYEYGAAGLRVLSRRTAEVVRRDEPFVVTYDDPASVVQAAARLLGEVGPAVPAPTAERLVETSWSSLAQRLLDLALEG